MLEMLVKIITTILLTATNYYIIEKITNKKVELLNLKNCILLLSLVMSTALLYQMKYEELYTITVFLLNIVVYKIIFKFSVHEGIIAIGLSMITISFGDLITSLIVKNFYTIETIRANLILFLITNLMVSVISIIMIKIPPLIKTLQKFYVDIQKHRSIMNTLLFILIILGYSIIAFYIANYKIFDIEYIRSLLIIIIFAIIIYIFAGEKNKYNQLTDEYDSLFTYVQNFEDWIEKEQFNRHEYKNQLAVLRCLSKEKKVKNKIDEMLEDNLNLEGEVVRELKSLPKGGIKGLMYYKSALAQKNKINLTVNVSLNHKGLLTKLSENDIKILCKLIGVYFDNAIEAAKETRKKVILIEVYELKDKVNFVFSNTFKKNKSFEDRNKKGVSSKGEGRGNGLYFASKLISKNNWLTEKQEVIDKYYIQQLAVKKKISK